MPGAAARLLTSLAVLNSTGAPQLALATTDGRLDQSEARWPTTRNCGT
jgi:hypothetical protein